MFLHDVGLSSLPAFPYSWESTSLPCHERLCLHSRVLAWWSRATVWAPAQRPSWLSFSSQPTPTWSALPSLPLEDCSGIKPHPLHTFIHVLVNRPKLKINTFNKHFSSNNLVDLIRLALFLSLENAIHILIIFMHCFECICYTVLSVCC